jgi:hypothetical protein
MKVTVKPHSVEIKKEEVTNQGEYNVQSCEFQFSSEYDGLKKVAVFSKGSTTIDIDLIDDTCTIPYEMLENEGIVTLGVYGYEIDGDDLVKRYSPTTDRFLVQSGSYKLGEEPTPPSPSVIEKMQADIAKNTDDINDLQEEQITQNSNIQTNTENIITNTNDIIDIKAEQATQNANIQNNTNAISTNTSDISNIKTEQTTQNTNIANNTANIATLTTNLGNETTARENADMSLQNQIDAITVSSDVVDVVGTYQELQNYDTTHIKANDIIKVLQDSTHDNALSYYRWVITNNVGAWVYVGSEGPFYTKGETDTILTDYVKNTDYATDSVGGVIKTRAGFNFDKDSSGRPFARTRDYETYNSQSNDVFISKGTLENVLNARIGDIDTILTTLTTGNGV